MCCLFNSRRNRSRTNSRFYAPAANRTSPRMNRYLENDLAALASNGNNGCCSCGCCPCCCELAYNNRYGEARYDSCETNGQTYSPESYCRTSYNDSHNDCC